MTTKEPSNVIDPEILISVEQPQIEVYTEYISKYSCNKKCVTLNSTINSDCFYEFCYICFISMIVFSLTLVVIVIILLSYVN